MFDYKVAPARVQFNVWITVPGFKAVGRPKDWSDPKEKAPTVPSDEHDIERIMTALMLRGFSVGPLGRRLALQYTDNPAKMICFSIARTPVNEEEKNAYTPGGIYEEVMNVLKTKNVKFFSIVVAEGGGCTWNTGNMSVTEEQKQLVTKMN